MAIIKVTCPQCREGLSAEDSQVGQKVRCGNPECQTTFVVRNTGSASEQAQSFPREAGRRKRQIGEDGIPLVWEPGDVILDLYEVRPLSENQPFAEGGMGRVNRVWHRGWQTDLAVKSVHPEKISNPSMVENFKREAEVWVNQLGLHPHIVSCHYVRVLGSLPRIFAEFVDGGTLLEWIRSGQLYAGGPDLALQRILDVGIQFAWGLHYAHEQGLIHQDVKPANVMLTKDGVARVTDFGLAKARAFSGEEKKPPPKATILASWGGMTEAYCSPEQARIGALKKAGVPKEKWPSLTRQTDLWSWAVSMLEMFTGEVTWHSGQVAGAALERYLQVGTADEKHPRMPVELRELLRKCFLSQPEARPKDMLEVANLLKQIFQSLTNAPYRRQEAKPAEGLAATLNNRAVSLLDLGKQKEAKELWQKGLKAEEYHPESTYNLGLVRWRAGEISDESFLLNLKEVAASYPRNWLPWYLLAEGHLEKGDSDSALRALQKIPMPDNERDEVLSLLGLAGQVGFSPKCLNTFGETAEPKTWEEVVAVCFTPDGYALAGTGLFPDEREFLPGAGSFLGKIQVWNVLSGKPAETFDCHHMGLTALCISGNGQFLLSAGRDRMLQLWESLSGRFLAKGKDPSPRIRSVYLSQDGDLVLSGGDDQLCRLWEVVSKKRLCANRVD